MARLPSIPLLPQLMQSQHIRPVHTVAGTLANIPPSILNAKPGAQIEGTISTLAKGMATLQTPQGKMMLQTSLPLYVGERMTLQILKSGNQMHVRLVALDGESVIHNASHTKGSSANPNLALAAAKMHEHAILFIHQPGREKQRDKIDTNPAVIFDTDGSQLKGGETVKSMLLQVRTHGMEAWLQKLLKSGMDLSSLLPTHMREELEKQHRKLSPKLFSDGTKALCRMWQIHIPHTEILSELTDEQRQSGHFLEAKILGTEKSGQLIAKTSIGTISLPSLIQLPKGTSLWLEPIMLTPPHHDQVEYDMPYFSTTYQMLQHWQALGEQLQHMPNTDATEKAIQSLLPVAGKDFARSMMQFWSRLMKGDSMVIPKKIEAFLKRTDQGWLNDAIEADLEEMRDVLLHPDELGWVNLIFPIWSAGSMHYGRLSYHKQIIEKEEQTHFVIEWETSLTGTLQCEGFVKRPDKHTDTSQMRGGKCDLILKTAITIAETMQHDIQDIYHAILTTTAMKGEIRFTTLAANPIDSPSSPKSNLGGGIIA